jgi:beta-lactamase class A
MRPLVPIHFIARCGITLFIGVSALLYFSMFTLQAQPVIESLRDLEKRSGGTLGVYALHVEKREVISWHEFELFPMTSLTKLPIGVCFLRQVNMGKISLLDSVVINQENVAPGFSPLKRRWEAYGDFKLSYGELLKWMVSDGDNTASDILLHRVDGAVTVRKYFSDAGLKNFTVDRSERKQAMDQVGVAVPSLRLYNVMKVDSILAAADRRGQLAVVRKVLQDRRDSTTPKGFADLLVRLHQRSLPGITDYGSLLKLLTQTSTGLNRIRASLPEDASLAHKTGTHRTLAGINIATNDAGIITLPGGEHIILVILLKGSVLDSAAREKIIADTADVVLGALWHVRN